MKKTLRYITNKVLEKNPNTEKIFKAARKKTCYIQETNSKNQKSSEKQTKWNKANKQKKMEARRRTTF